MTCKLLYIFYFPSGNVHPLAKYVGACCNAKYGKKWNGKDWIKWGEGAFWLGAVNLIDEFQLFKFKNPLCYEFLELPTELRSVTVYTVIATVYQNFESLC
jgi:hypothetical protein